MFEVAESCDYHSYTVGIAIVDRLLVADRTSRMNNSCHACLVCNLYTADSLSLIEPPG